MIAQLIQDDEGKTTGVFITIEDWEQIKRNYPNIETFDYELPQWQKDILDERIKDLDKPEMLRPISDIFDFID
ncbi:addiction module component CHP02574 family protein [Myroides sp. N17-2]|uniref:addiction module component CHP02574 family protein n=1 Tax=Myroides sp. N17-2 TaxID=2030799 RepID=UPI000EFD7695|nr:addiction module component CHP02574 family protein [Myroides sp. N17-2]